MKPVKVLIQTPGGEKSVNGFAFVYEGRDLTVTPSVDVLRPCYRITEPMTGMAIPQCGGETPEEAYQSFLSEVPKLERLIQEKRPGATFLQWLDNGRLNPDQTRSDARTKWYRDNGRVSDAGDDQ